MQQTNLTFPDYFLWGTATSSHQVEGDNTRNNWWDWEQQPGRIVHGHKSGKACDWWGGRWQEDFDRAAEGGQNAHRLSIEWSRIQPDIERWDREALNYYVQMIRGLHQRNLKPMVTLHHFTDPLWLTEMGGWENPRTPSLFVSYVRTVVEALKKDVNMWCTINEPNVYVYCGYLQGVFPPGKKSLRSGFEVMYNLVRAHAQAYHIIHELQPEAMVGIALSYRGMKPARKGSALDRWVSRTQSRLYNEFFPWALKTGILRFLFNRRRVEEARSTQDFLGINYYTCDRVAFDFHKPTELFGRHFYPEGVELSENKFIANVPEGLFQALLWGNKLGIPLIVTENGIEDSQDILRPRYTVQHIYQVWRAIQEKCPVKGYFHWSLVDNFEWERGWTQRFGLWELDVESQVRSKRSTVDIYAQICKNNGLSKEILDHYGKSH